MVVMAVIVIVVFVVMAMMMIVAVVMVTVRTTDMVRIVVVEEARIVFQRPFEIECALVQNLGEIDARAGGGIDAGRGVDGAHDVLDAMQFVMADEVGLVDDDDVGKGDLVLGLATVLQTQRQVLRVDQGDHGIEFGLGAHVVVHEEGLGDRHRIGKAGGLDDDAVETAGAAHQAFHHADQVAAHGAADAAVVHLVDLFVRLDDQVVIDADLAELVDDDRIFLAVIVGEDAVQKRRLAGAEIAGEHGDGNGFCGSFGHENLDQMGRGRCACNYVTPYRR